MKYPPFPSVNALASLTLALGLAAFAPAQAPSPLITGNIDNTQRVTLPGNTRPEAIATNDLGAADAGTPLNALQLVLQRSPEGEAAFTQYLAELYDPSSPNYHKWLTNQQIGDLFGPSAADIAIVKDWLTSEGFSVNSVSPDKTVIEFSGTAGQVSNAFDAPLHNLSVNGKAHLANVNDPDIPAALAPVVAGVAKLNDFMPHALNLRRAASHADGRKGVATGGFTAYLGAADLAAIYNFNPLFKAGITGKGQTIVLIEDTNQYSASDWATFRSVLGLTAAFPYGTLTQINPTGTNRCVNPGVGAIGGTGNNAGDDVEAAIDVDWASAAAPNAAIVNAACADTTTQFGGFLALANLLQGKNPPPVVSISYGEAEALNGAAENLYIYKLYQTAAAEGVSIFVSSGDEDAASSAGGSVSTYGIGVSGFTSTPYNISVGGTDFGYIPLGTPGTYFNAANGPNFQTAVSYIPEIPWNDSCAGSLLVGAIGSPFTTYGPDSVCNNYLDFVTQAEANEGVLLNAVGGSGGPSGCAAGNPSLSGVVSGSCQGYAKPYWQRLIGVPKDGVQRILGRLLRSLHLRPHGRLRLHNLHRRSLHLGRLWRHLGLQPHLGRHPSAGQSEDRGALGQLQHRPLQPCRCRVRQVRKSLLQLFARKRDWSRLLLQRRHAGRQRGSLPGPGNRREASPFDTDRLLYRRRHIRNSVHLRLGSKPGL
jgi:subtilase family serine protease